MIFFTGCGEQSTPRNTETAVQRDSHDQPAKDTVQLVSSGMEVKKLAAISPVVERCKTEGPVSDANGNVFFTDPYGACIYKWSQDGTISVFTDKSGGANGLFLDSEGNIIAVQAYRRGLAAFDRTGKETILLSTYKGKKFNEPNDIYVDQKDGIYFTDPYYHVHYDSLELDGEHVYYLKPDRTDVLRVNEDIAQPNGIHGNPDGTLLYVIDTEEHTTYVFDVNNDGTLSNKRLFVATGYDGMTLDQNGNVYITTGADKTVLIYDRNGTLLETITVPESTWNVCFGGKDNSTLFITAGRSLYSIQINVKGM
jgi:gluconolactonase